MWIKVVQGVLFLQLQKDMESAIVSGEEGGQLGCENFSNHLDVWSQASWKEKERWKRKTVEDGGKIVVTGNAQMEMCTAAARFDSLN